LKISKLVLIGALYATLVNSAGSSLEPKDLMFQDSAEASRLGEE
jgi:hypothetical protein